MRIAAGHLAPLLLFACASACDRAAPPPVVVTVAPAAAVEPAAWPSARARLTRPSLTLPAGFRPRRIYLDAGHGAPGNSGTVSVTCEQEQVYTLRIARELGRRLAATGAYEVKLSRDALASPTYGARLAEARAWSADAILSIHMDARGEGVAVNRSAEGRECFRNEDHPGFAVLWSDEAAAPLGARRHELATALAARLAATGFLPYDGADYRGLYENDALQPGVFLDRHPPGRRVWLLKAPALPVVIVETHHSWSFEEHARWKEDGTLDAFAAATAAGLADFFTGPGG
ncbi:MAG: N-acetylmuramoyl-L-alanine amidase family protein [Myxococcaceae bacterium]